MSERHPEPSGWEKLEWLFPAVWLVFLVYPIGTAVDAHAGLWATGLTIAALAGFAVLYVLGYTLWCSHPWATAAGLAALTLACVPVLGVEVISLAPFVGAYAALALPTPWWPWVTGLVALVPLLGWAAGGFPLFYFLIVWPCLTVCSLIRVLGETSDRRRAADRELAVVAERERVARDVHDVLGHSLTVLSVKAELAARLIDLDPDRAREELESIQQTARQALNEVRLTVGGLRGNSLADELRTAPHVLADAGVQVRVVGEIADTDPQRRSVLAWVLRESVTNVVRHARATSVVIEVGPHGLSVTDDGTGPGQHSEGNGLRGMRERVEKAGGTLVLSGTTPGTKVQVRWA